MTLEEQQRRIEPIGTETDLDIAKRLGISRQRIDQIRYPEKHTARSAVMYAIKTGKLIKPEHCEACGQSKRLHCHHPDYSKPLEVQWLCAPCHGRAHSTSPPREPTKPITPVTDDMLQSVMRELGRRGGKSTSEKKKAAVRKSLEKARAARKQKRSQQNEQCS